jgi:hypothetical protein
VSIDIYYVIRRHPRPEGGYAAVMGFVSNSEDPRAQIWHRAWPTVETALQWARWVMSSEHGVTVHPECRWHPQTQEIQ